MTSQPGLQITVMHILLNISRSKDNQAMKFGQLIEYKKRNIFFLKIIHRMRQRNQSPYLKNQVLTCLWINSLKFNTKQFVLIVCQVEAYGNILKLSCTLLAFTSFYDFLKIKEVWNYSPCLIVCRYLVNEKSV